jgi:hypothetical protein
MVAAGGAEISHENGRVRSIKLIECAATCVTRIGPATTMLLLNTRFVRRVQTHSGCTWIEHHRRSLDPPEQESGDNRAVGQPGASCRGAIRRTGTFAAVGYP